MKAMLNTLIVVIGFFLMLSIHPVIANDTGTQGAAVKSVKSPEESKKEEEQQQEKERLEYVKDYEASGIGKIERVDDYIHLYYVKNRFDARTDHFEVTAVPDEEGIHLKGSVMNEGMRSGVVDLLEKLLFESIDCEALIVLPDPALGENTWGLVSVPVLGPAKEFDDREHFSELGEYTYGAAFQILKKSTDGRFAYVSSPEGYLGWVSMKGIVEIPLETWQRRKRGPFAFMKESVVVNPDNGEVKVTDCNLNDDELKEFVAFPKSSLQLLDDQGKIVLVDGRTVAIEKDLYRFQDPAQNPLRKIVVEFAKSFQGTPYVWGGRCNVGLDCSGLTQAAYEAVGIPLARDSHQQVISGEIVGTRFNYAAALPGDLIFFARHPGRVFHTAIYLGDGKFIHATHTPGVTIHTIDPEDPNHSKYLAARVASIRRILR